MVARFLRLFLLFLGAVFLTACQSYLDGILRGSATDSSNQNNSLTLSSFKIENVSSISFDVSFTFTGDANSDSNVKIYFCSIKQQPGCNPLDGSFNQLVPSGNKIIASIDLSQPPFTPGDILKYKIVSSDADGLSGGGEEYGHIIIPYDGSPRILSQLGYITMGEYVDAGTDENVFDAAIDSDGNMFIAGHTPGSLGEPNAGGNDAFVIKLDSSGNLDTSFGGGDGIAQLGSVTVGTKASSNDQVSAIGLDSNGYIYVAGYTNSSLGEANAGGSDAYVFKLDSSGNLDTNFGGGDGIAQLGNVTVGAAASLTDLVYAMALDSSGNIFVAGHTGGALGEANAGSFTYDAFVFKLNSSGNLDTSFGGDGIVQLGGVTVGAAASGSEYVFSVDVDSSGNIFVAGHTNGSLGEAKSGNNDAYVFKLNSSGSLDTSFGGDGIVQLGDVTVGAAASSNDSVTSLSLDSNGNVFVAGHTFGSLGETKSGNYDVYVFKVDSFGSLDTSFGGGDGIAQLGSITVGAGASGTEYLRAISVDSSGGLYIAGETSGSSLGEADAGMGDSYVIKLDSSGSLDGGFNGDGIVQLGNVTVGAGASGDESVSSLIIDSSGKIFVVGDTTGSLGEANAGGKDVYAFKLDSSGSLDGSFKGNGIVQLGNVTSGGAASGDDYVSSISVDSSGNLFIAGHTKGSLGEANAGGEDAYVFKLNSSGYLDTSFGGGDGILQLGMTTIGAAAASGDYVSAMALDSSGNIFVAGHTDGSLGEAKAGYSDAYVFKLNPSGDLDTSFGGGDGILQLGNITVGLKASGEDYVSALSLDSSGNIFVAGRAYSSIGETKSGGYDAYVFKLDSSGDLDTSFGGGDGIAQLGNVTVGANASGNEFVSAIGLDSSGNIYVAGYTTFSLGETFAGGHDAYVFKLDSSGNLDTSFGGSDGIAQLGNDTVGAAAIGNDYVTSMILDSSGNIFVAGNTSGSLGEAVSGSNDVYVFKLDSSGNLDTSFSGDGIVQLGNVTIGAGASSYDNASTIALDSSGNIFVAGYTSGSLGETNSGSNDTFVFKLDSTGSFDLSFGGSDGIAQLGNDTIGTAASGNDYVSAISLDSSGNIIISGNTTGSLVEANAGGNDSYFIKLDSSGAIP